MDGHRHVDAVTDPLDREIESMLAVDPSPEFLARVRTRVAEEPDPRAWRWSWLVATAGAVAMVIVAVMVWPSRDSASPNTAPEPSPQISGAVETVPPRASSPATVPAPGAQRTALRAVAVAASPDRAIDIDLPAVVIAENEVRTYASLVTSIRQSRFDVAVPVAPNPDTPLEVKEMVAPSPVIVEPIEIEPIVQLAALQPQGDRP